MGWKLTKPSEAREWFECVGNIELQLDESFDTPKLLEMKLEEMFLTSQYSLRGFRRTFICFSQRRILQRSGWMLGEQSKREDITHVVCEAALVCLENLVKLRLETLVRASDADIMEVQTKLTLR